MQEGNNAFVEDEGNNENECNEEELFGSDVEDDVSVTDSFLEALKLDLPLDNLVQLSKGIHMNTSIIYTYQKYVLPIYVMSR